MLPITPRPIDATLTVTKAARHLGVHPNTVRTWSDQGRLRYYRINRRGDRRYRVSDLNRFLAVAESSGSGPRGRDAAAAPAAGPSTDPGRAAESRDLASHHREMGLEDGAAGRAMGRLEFEFVAKLASLIPLGARASRPDLPSLLRRAADLIRSGSDVDRVAIFELRGDELVPRGATGPGATRLTTLPRSFGILGRALAAAGPDRSAGDSVSRSAMYPAPGAMPAFADSTAETAVAIAGPLGAWGVLVLARRDHLEDAIDPAVGIAVADVLGALIQVALDADDVAHRLHRAEALRRVEADIASRLDLEPILAQLVDHALVLFEGDRAAVLLSEPSGGMRAKVSRGLSPSFLSAVKDLPPRSLSAAAVAARRPLAATHYRDDPRGEGVRAAVIQEGFDSLCVAPLIDGDDVQGLLVVYHDRPHEWTNDDIETMAALAGHATAAIRTAQNYEKLSTWAAQLQAIQQLGGQVNRLATVADIARTIATELRQLIDYHNVRIYRVEGDDLVPVAMLGHLGEYVDETPEQLAGKIGVGITGWVARHGVAQYLPDAAKDPRASTIPGTEDDLDESMLLAPMIFEDEVVGVLVLAKLGLHQFTEDDLRLLVIFASIAAQAMANAESTERLRSQSEALERQLRSQRVLLTITESILSTLDPREVLDQIADRLAGLVEYDNISIEVLDRASGALRPLTARGVHAAEFMKEWKDGETGLATWVIENNEPVLVDDEFDDERVFHFESTARVHGSLILAPLRDHDGVAGVLTLERLGTGRPYTADEFELVKLFAAHVSISLQNAAVHRAVEIKARTDDLTGLLNRGTFSEWLNRNTISGDPFSLIMLDLDDFRTVNNDFGHQAGDRMLREIARALGGAGRDSDMIFRYGGDEFAFILPTTEAAGARVVAERAQAAVKAVSTPTRQEPRGRDWRAGPMVSASIGVATYPVDGASAEEVLLAADRAAYVAKRSGGDRVATAAEGLALAGEFSMSEPTPVDSPDRVTS